MYKIQIQNMYQQKDKKRNSGCMFVNIASANKASIAGLADESPIPYVDHNTPATGQSGKMYVPPHK